MKNKQYFGNKLREIRERKNFTQRDMSKKLGCSQSTYSNYENGTTLPSVGILVKTSTTFKISVDVLLGLKEEEKITLSTTADILECFFEMESKGLVEVTPYGMCFINLNSYNGFVQKWNKVREACSNSDIGSEMYQLWKKEELRKVKDVKIQK